MAKKKNNKQLIFFAVLLLGVAAIAMYFLPFVRLRLGGDDIYEETLFSGFNCMFGAEKITVTGVIKDTKVSAGLASTKLVPVVLISGILLVVAIVAALLIKIVDKKKVFIVKVITAGLFIAAAVLAVALVKTSFLSANDIGSGNYYSVGIGAILSCVFSALAGAGILLS